MTLAIKQYQAIKTPFIYIFLFLGVDVKIGKLRSIGHNISDSLASGVGLLIGVYATEIFGEAARSPERYILVDFLNGTTSGGPTSESLAKAIALYAKALCDLCQRHGTDISAFRELTTRYSVERYGPRFVVTVQDQAGRCSVDEYLGVPGRRVMVRDASGLIRPKRSTGSTE